MRSNVHFMYEINCVLRLILTTCIRKDLIWFGVIDSGLRARPEYVKEE